MGPLAQPMQHGAAGGAPDPRGVPGRPPGAPGALWARPAGPTGTGVPAPGWHPAVLQLLPDQEYASTL